MTQIIINDVLPYTQIVASGGQTIFSAMSWTANAASDVIVYYTPSGDAPNDFTQQLATNLYTVQFIGGNRIVQVTLVNPASLGDQITITRQTPASFLNLYTNTNFVPSMLNNDFGILTLVDQQAQLANEIIAPHYNYSALINNDAPGADTILPILGPNQFWVKNSNGTAIIAVDAGEILGGVTEIDTGLGLTGGPITSTGTISFGPMPAHTFWANTSASTALPVATATSYFLASLNNLSDLTNVVTARTNLGVAIGVNVEAWSPALDSIAGLTTSANQMLITNGSNSYAVISAIANAVLTTSSGSVPVFAAILPTAVQSNITQLGAQTQQLNMNSHKIVNLTDPTNPQDAATRAYVLAQTGGTFLPLSGGTMSGAIDMGNFQINHMADPSSAQDAVTLSYLNTQLGFKLSLSGGTMSGQINMGSKKIISLLDPTNPQDAATKNYVDSVAVGLTIQPAVAVATTANLNATYSNGASGIGATLTNAGSLVALVIDGYTVATNDRILVKNQTTTLQNGIYTATNVGSGAVAWILTRATDYDQPSEIQPGDLVIVNNGTVSAGASYIETASVSAVGTDPILFSQFTFAATAVLLKANNLSDVANTTTSFNNISPLTTKGDLIGFSTQNIRVAVGGTNTQILQVDSSAAAGISWSTATYPKTTTVNQILYSSATNTVTGIGTLAGGVLVTDASSVPQFLTNPSAAGKILQSANAAIPTWSTPTYPSASGASGKFLISDGTNNVYSTSTIPSSAGATANKLLLSDGTNYVLSTPTFPNASATSNKIIKSDGTNWIASTETYAAPGTSGNVLTSDGTNWTSAPNAGVALLTTKGDLFSFSTVPARFPVATGDGKILQVLASATTGLAYSTPTYPSASGTSGKWLVSDGTNNVYSTSTFPTSAGATAGKIPISDGTNYVLSTPTFPNSSAASRKIIVSDGTNWVASTETYATPGSSGNVMTSDGTNWTSATPSGNKVLQRVSTITGAVATGSTTIASTDSVPTSSNGDQYMSLAITPTSSSSILVIDVSINLSSSNTGQMAATLLQYSTTNALAAIQGDESTSGRSQQMFMRYIMTSGTTSATTFKVRAGNSTAGTTTFNGHASGRNFGGIMASGIMITEYAA